MTQWESPTFRLIKRKPSFLSGVSSLMDMNPEDEKYNISETEKEADYLSLLADWQAIGDDMKKALNEYVYQNDNNLVQNVWNNTEKPRR